MYQIPTLPLKQDVENKAVLKQAAQAHRLGIRENLPKIYPQALLIVYR